MYIAQMTTNRELPKIASATRYGLYVRHRSRTFAHMLISPMRLAVPKNRSSTHLTPGRVYTAPCNDCHSGPNEIYLTEIRPSGASCPPRASQNKLLMPISQARRLCRNSVRHLGKRARIVLFAPAVSVARSKPLPYAIRIVYGIHRFNGPQKNAIIRSNIGSSGECWLKWADK